MFGRGKRLDWVLGIDVSTGGVKVMIMAVETDGRAVRLTPPGPLPECVVQADHDVGGDGRSPASWIATYRACLSKLSARFPEEVAKVRAAGLSTIFPGLYILPKTGDLDLSLVRQYNDLDSAETITRHADAFADLERENRNVVYPGTMVANLLFLLESGRIESNSEIACIAPPNTAFVWQLYREAHEDIHEYISDFSQIVIGGVLEPGRFERCRALKRLFGTRSLPFAAVRPSWHNVLATGGDALVRLRGVLGLPALESLAIGAGDSACGGLALGAVLAKSGCRLVNIRGTSDTPMVVVPRPYKPRRRFQECLFHYPSPVTGDAQTAEWFAAASILRSGAAWRWTKTICGMDHEALENAAKERLLRTHPENLCRRDLPIPIRRLETPPTTGPRTVLGRTPRSPTTEKVVFVPFLGGERAPTWNPDARGIIFGLTAETAQGDLALATVEGVSFALRADLELMRARYPREMSAADSMIMAGKPARSGLWNWITEQITGLRVESPSFSEASVLGAALIGWASIQPEKERRRRLIQASLASRELLLSEKTPDPGDDLSGIRDSYRADCERAYAEFRELYRRLLLREPEHARLCEEEFAGKRSKVDRPLRG